MEQYNNKATASLVLGIISLVSIFTGYFVLIGIVCSIVGLIFGIQIRKAAQLEGFNPSNIATAGFILSLIGVALCTIVFISCVVCVSVLIPLSRITF